MISPRRIRSWTALAIISFALPALHPDSSRAAWVQTAGPKGGSIRSLAVVPNGAGGSTLFAGSNHVWRLDPNGSSWSHMKNGLTDPNAFSLLPVPNGTGGHDLLTGTYIGVFRSADLGASWSASSTGLPSLAVYALASGSNGSGGSYVYAGTFDGGLFRSSDNGSSWTSSSTGIPSGYNVNALVTTGAGTVLAGTMNGIYRSTNHGGSWSRVFTF
jgi:hypothetical protein